LPKFPAENTDFKYVEQIISDLAHFKYGLNVYRANSTFREDLPNTQYKFGILWTETYLRVMAILLSTYNIKTFCC
tara:strand:+ start:1230 stop:1454 length:225 start_codon:yes stop_codon:yes gene_type:complete